METISLEYFRERERERERERAVFELHALCHGAACSTLCSPALSCTRVSVLSSASEPLAGVFVCVCCESAFRRLKSNLSPPLLERDTSHFRKFSERPSPARLELGASSSFPGVSVIVKDDDQDDDRSFFFFLRTVPCRRIFRSANALAAC